MAQVHAVDLPPEQACALLHRIQQSNPGIYAYVTYGADPDWQCADWELEIYYETNFRAVPEIKEILLEGFSIKPFAALTATQLNNLAEGATRSNRLGEPELLAAGAPDDPASYFVNTPATGEPTETVAAVTPPAPPEQIDRLRANITSLNNKYDADNLTPDAPGRRHVHCAQELAALAGHSAGPEAGAILLEAASLLYDTAVARHEQIVNARQWVAAISQPTPR